MSKRFVDTEIWQKEWFLDLSIKHKLLLKFLFDNCDCAGIYEPNFKLLSFYIGEKITPEDFNNIKQIKKLPNGNYLIEDFIKFQYKINNYSELNPSFSVHKGIIKSLIKNQLLDKGCLTLKQPLQDMDKDKDINTTNNSTNNTKFNKPTIEEIKNYCLERKNNVDPSQFFDFYESKNWFVGKNEMKDWKAAIRNWERNCKRKTEIESGNSHRYETGEAKRLMAMRMEKRDKAATDQAFERCALKMAKWRKTG